MEKSDKSTWILWFAIVIFAVVIISPFVYYLIVVNYFPEQENRGLFGDMFGGLNAVFSGLAFAGLIVTLLLQHKELKLQHEELALQRKELVQTREVLNEQKGQLEAQNKTMMKQNFENTFFQLLRLHNDIVGQLYVVIKIDRTAKGRFCFFEFYTRLKKIYQQEKNQFVQRM